MESKSGETDTAPLGIFSRCANMLSDLGGALSGLCIVAILIIVCTEVVLRQLKLSLLVTDEIGGYLNAAVVFLGLAYTLRTGGFIRVEVVYDLLPARIKVLARWLFTLASTGFVGLIFYYACLHVIYAFNQDTRAVSVLETPEWIPQSIMVLGLGILVLQLLAMLIGRVRNVP
ncbi:MAG: TRAP transporter small permease [Alphaproteobacteria bacterium]|nr:TRAP transporter small permease [Alphaproteobacteria bacterium]